MYSLLVWMLLINMTDWTFTPHEHISIIVASSYSSILRSEKSFAVTAERMIDSASDSFIIGRVYFIEGTERQNGAAGAALIPAGGK